MSKVPAKIATSGDAVDDAVALAELLRLTADMAKLENPRHWLLVVIDMVLDRHLSPGQALIIANARQAKEDIEQKAMREEGWDDDDNNGYDPPRKKKK